MLDSVVSVGRGGMQGVSSTDDRGIWFGGPAHLPVGDVPADQGADHLHTPMEGNVSMSVCIGTHLLYQDTDAYLETVASKAVGASEPITNRYRGGGRRY